MQRAPSTLVSIVVFLVFVGCSRTERDVQRLKDSNPEVRLQTIKDLGYPSSDKPHTPIVEALAEAVIRDSIPSVRGSAIGTLSSYSRRKGEARAAHEKLAVEALLTALRNDSDLGNRVAAAAALGDFGDPHVTAALSSMLATGDWSVRARIAWSLESHELAGHTGLLIRAMEGIRSDIDRLFLALEQADGETRIRAVFAELQEAIAAHNSLLSTMNRIPDPVIVRPLRDALAAHEKMARWLRHFNFDKKLDRYVQNLYLVTENGFRGDELSAIGTRHFNGRLASETKKRIDSFGAVGIDEFLRLARMGHLQDEVLDAKDSGAVPALVRALNDKDARVRSASVAGLGTISDERAIEPLLAVIGHDPDSGIRARAVVALSRIGATAPPKVIATLVRALKSDSDEFVREAAATALGKRQAEESAGALVAALTDVSYNVRKAVADALWRREDNGRAIAALLAAMPDGGNTAQYVKALRRLANWQPSTDTERVYAWIADEDLASLTENWETTHRILMDDLKSRKQRRIENSVSTFFAIGKPEVIPEMIEALNRHGNKQMAILYLNSQQDDLSTAAGSWARRNGYQIETVRAGRAAKFGGGF